MSYLIQVRGRWLYRRRIPQDLQRHFPQPAIKRSLRTAKRATARPLAAKLDAALERLFLILRMNMLPDPLVKKIVALFLAQTLDAEEARRNGDGLGDALDELWGRLCSTPKGIQKTASAYRQQAAEYRQDLAIGALHHGLIPESVRGPLEATGYNLSEDGPDRQRLTREVQKAAAAAAEIEAERTLGKFDSELEQRTLKRYGLPDSGGLTASAVRALADSLDPGRTQESEQPATAIITTEVDRLLSIVAPHTQVKITLAEVAEKWLDDLKRKGRAKGTVDRYKRNLPLILGLLEGGRQIADFQRMDLLKLVDRIRGLPKNLNVDPRFKNLDLATLEKMRDAGEIPERCLMSKRTLNGYLGTVQDIFQFASENIWVGANPALGMRLPLTKAEEIASRRLGYTPEDLAIIFDDLPYTEGKPGKTWLPLLALYTGARLNEMLQLKTTDIREEDGIPFIAFQVIEEGDKLDHRTIKNEASRRKTPIHPRLAEAGFLRWIGCLRAAGRQALFPGMTGKALSNWWYSFLFGRIEGHQQKDFHSFRRTLMDGLKQRGVPESLYHSIAGHSPRDKTDLSYTQQHGLRIQLEALEKADFGVDFESLKSKLLKVL